MVLGLDRFPPVVRSLVLVLGALLFVALLVLGRSLVFGWHSVILRIERGSVGIEALNLGGEPESWVSPLVYFMGVGAVLMFVWSVLAGERSGTGAAWRYVGRVVCVGLVALALAPYTSLWASLTTEHWGGWYNVAVPILLALPLMGLLALRPRPGARAVAR